MTKAKKIIAGILAAGVFSLSLAGCTTFDNFKEAFINKNPQADDTIRIGVYEPMSGADKQQGELEVQGIELAHELYPKVLGKKVELIYADNKSDIDAADTAMADLIKKQPLAVLGSYGSIYSLVANDYLEAAKIPGIAMTNVNPLVTKNHPYYFRVCFVESYQGDALARYVYEQLKEKKTGILAPEDDDQATAMASSFKDKFVELTGDSEAIAVYQKFKGGDKDFSQQLQAIANSRVSTVFLPGDIPDAANILKQAKKMGISNVTFLGDSDWSTDEFMDSAGKYVYNNVAFSTLYTEEEAVTETSQEFLDAYSKEYGKDETAAAETALGFDAYLLAIKAIETAGENSTGEDIRQALAETADFEGASGKITFDSVGDPKKSVVINTIANKKIKPICTIDPVEPEKNTKKKDKKKENE
ncbi:ABC transporter substrate-binding protein [Anaerovorax odorimutans]|uniref:ABC transporter substrate-binding protein n=1 Tax=Anaerovorax odorimutans TaxID=109327 RepID=A0ABT1RLT8_9FIRM|nr:ABC transporter substrate-binding protein [Anaerovorax odorimutans]MCQ4636149.1 ABC transporter substrate-binding protein [Anaerovorax odorimutans]